MQLVDLTGGHTTSGAIRIGERNQEMPGLPYASFRIVNPEPGGGKPSPYSEMATVREQI